MKYTVHLTKKINFERDFPTAKEAVDLAKSFYPDFEVSAILTEDDLDLYREYMEANGWADEKERTIEEFNRLNPQTPFNPNRTFEIIGNIHEIKTPVKSVPITKLPEKESGHTFGGLGMGTF
jgi:hypothetical protein